VTKRSSTAKRPAAGPDLITGAVVSDLVDRNERQIEALQQELSAALHEAEESERRIVELAGSLPVGWPADGGNPDPGGTASDSGGKHSRRPRTTVVSRER
jgi:hypothetical protein